MLFSQMEIFHKSLMGQTTCSPNSRVQNVPLAIARNFHGALLPHEVTRSLTCVIMSSSICTAVKNKHHQRKLCYSGLLYVSDVFVAFIPIRHPGFAWVRLNAWWAIECVELCPGCPKLILIVDDECAQVLSYWTVRDCKTRDREFENPELEADQGTHFHSCPIPTSRIKILSRPSLGP